MPGPAASATSVGAGSPRGGGGSSPRAGLCKQLEVWQSRRADCKPSQEEEEWDSVQGRLPPRVVALSGLVAPAVEACGGSTQMTVLESRFVLSFFTRRQSPSFYMDQSRCVQDNSIPGWSSSSACDVPAVHCLCIHAPYLGQVQQGLGQSLTSYIVIFYIC